MKDLKFTFKLLGLSVKALTANLFRTILTMLGIIIGSLTIIIVVALGEGAKRDIEQQYSSMSVTTILVNAPSTVEGARSKLNFDDIEELKKIDSLQTVIPQLSGKVQMQAEGKSSNLSVLGTTSDVQTLASLKMVAGKFWDDSTDSRSKVVVIGAIVAEELFGSRTADVIGKTILVGKKEFEIIGLLEYKGGSVGPTTIDDSIFVPYESAYRYILGVNGRFNVNAQAKDVSRINEAVDQIAVVLRQTHNLKVGMNDSFQPPATPCAFTNSEYKDRLDAMKSRLRPGPRHRGRQGRRGA